MAKKTKPQNNGTESEVIASISIRDVEVQVWHDFKKLAVIYDMSIQEYLKHLVTQEMSHVSISKKSK